MRRALAIALVAAAALWPGAPAGAADSFTFYGSGWGHGLGLSQWGAYGLAQQGWTSGQILTHFYSGTRVVKDPDPPASLRIGLAQGKSAVHLQADEGDVALVLGDPETGQPVGTVPAGQTWTVRSAGQRYRILDATGAPVGQDVGGPNENLYAVYAETGSILRIPEAGHSYNRGWIEFNLYDCSPRCTMRLVLTIDPEQYLYGLGEVPSDWPKAALQTQAIAARTYAFYKAALGQNRPGCNCALYASSLDQVYAGYDKEAGPSGARWVAAVNATASKVVVYHGAVIEAFYTSSSGGYTENNENVWGGAPIPYLRGVCDPGDYTPANPNAVWQVTLSAKQVTKRLDLGIGAVTGFTDTVRGVSGRIITTVVQGQNGTATVSGGTLRSLLGLNDDRVWINANRQVTGSIRQKYDAIGCRPGLPTSAQKPVAGGERQAFQRGTIYFKDGLGAHDLSGAVLAFYLQQGGPAGALGFPTSDVETLANGATRATFEHGTITCSVAGECRTS
ncbi:MAG TPA: SpoIID/LytB domain-containing protein [Actinomycetota bacterium]|nr:SpoIID/LytB domain-containing protein [Actinomycetota bacterium]